MREWMNIINENAAQRLYHGTSGVCWQEIQANGFMTDGENGGPEAEHGAICFSKNDKVSEDFARLACQRDNCEEGVVIVFDAAALARDFKLVQHSTGSVDPSWGIKDEEEMRIAVNRIPDVARYIVSVYEVWKDSPWNHGPLAGDGF